MDRMQLPPERDLPDADRMLARILDDERPAHRPSWVIPAAAAAAVVAVGAGAALTLHRPATSPGPAGSVPALASSVPQGMTSPSTGQASGSVPNTPAAASTGPDGTQLLDGPGTAQFPHFRVTVDDAPSPTAAGQVARRVSVCVVTLGPDPVNGRTRISWDPWSATQDGADLPKVTSAARQQPALPFDQLFAPGTCSTGFVTFAGDPSAPVTLRYRNGYGEQAVWTLNP